MTDDDLTMDEMNQLAQFNAEGARGIMHREDWCRRMSSLQERFNRMSARGVIRVVDNPWPFHG